MDLARSDDGRCDRRRNGCRRCAFTLWRLCAPFVPWVVRVQPRSFDSHMASATTSPSFTPFAPTPASFTPDATRTPSSSSGVTWKGSAISGRGAPPIFWRIFEARPCWDRWCPVVGSPLTAQGQDFFHPMSHIEATLCLKSWFLPSPQALEANHKLAIAELQEQISQRAAQLHKLKEERDSISGKGERSYKILQSLKNQLEALDEEDLVPGETTGAHPQDRDPVTHFDFLKNKLHDLLNQVDPKYVPPLGSLSLMQPPALDRTA